MRGMVLAKTSTGVVKPFDEAPDDLSKATVDNWYVLIIINQIVNHYTTTVHHKCALEDADRFATRPPSASSREGSSATFSVC